MKVYRNFLSDSLCDLCSVTKWDIQDGLAHVVVMKTFRGWHCPHCSYISPSQKGNLKVHILNRLASIIQLRSSVDSVD